MKDQNVTIGAYESNAGLYDQESWQRGTYVNIPELLERIGSRLPKIVELGCGSGREAKQILDLCPEADYLGMDGSRELIKIAKKKVPNARFINATFEDFQIPKGPDAVFAFASLLHADKFEMKRLLESAGRSLNRGGILFMTLQLGEYHKVVKKDEMGERVFYLYTPKDIQSLLPQKVFRSIFSYYQLRSKRWFNTTLIKK